MSRMKGFFCAMRDNWAKHSSLSLLFAFARRTAYAAREENEGNNGIPLRPLVSPAACFYIERDGRAPHGADARADGSR
jgi:hypothetical protein